jgi:hypothetical protein
LICYDLYCGLGGWTEGFLANGYRCIGFDIEAHNYNSGGYPGELRLRDIRSIHGSELKDATCIVASPPCQEPSYRAMCWKRAKALTPEEAGLTKPSWWHIPERASNKARGMTAAELREWREWQKEYPRPAPILFIQLFNECFRIQREASEAAGRHIPMVVENVRGAQKWVGRAAWNFGSYYLWGDVPALMPQTLKAQKMNPDGTSHGQGSWFAVADSKNRGSKVPGFRFDGSGRSFQTASVEGTKGGGDWFGSGANCSLQRRASSKSNARKAASAQIAKIPFPLADWIAKTYTPPGR